MDKDIISKLKLYMELPAKQNIIPLKYKHEIHNVIEGYEGSESEDSCFVIENRLPLSYLYGGYKLGEALNIKKDILSKICPDIGTYYGSDSADCDIKITDFVFLDTETTGLSGGTGTLAFLIGIGFFTDKEFVIRQYFMRDYNEENDLLDNLTKVLACHKGLVTFNGKAFDWNLLETRYIFNRQKIPLKQILHMDLLYPSRRIWRLKLESCALSSLEENILSEYRVNDIPGAMIPSVYFKYLIDRDAREIKRVIKHNEQDVLSMVALLLKINEMLLNPLSNAECSHELLGLSRMFESFIDNHADNKSYIDCLKKCLESDNYFIKESALKKLSLYYKRKGEYDEAVKYWHHMSEENTNLNLFPLIELAKYYEHKEKNYVKALDFTEKAVQVSYKMGIGNNIYMDDLKKRLNRIKTKIARSKQKSLK